MNLTKAQAKARILELMDITRNGTKDFVVPTTDTWEDTSHVTKGYYHVGKVEIFQLLDEIYDENPILPTIMSYKELAEHDEL